MSKKQDLSYAEYCLEKWAEWSLDLDGFAKVSSIAKLGEASSSNRGSSQVPNGVEIPSRDVGHVLKIFKAMLESSDKGAKRVHILRILSLGRKGNENISQAMKRMNLGLRRADYYDAIEDFSGRLEMALIYGN